MERGNMESNRLAAKFFRPMKRIGLWLLPFASLGILFNLILPSDGAAGEIALLHTNNVTAHLFPCPT
jgi:hypothetical protein